ncbi:hypothetical protein [Mesorhizobium sp.]|uniref:hypothetical protein n=1 Tax=Mesorhizobium sp. TaxID=1871066 RepID=UPI000FE992C7|nr:hypothetical protein [Mesorhizobium sp.]RWP30579.1 MAG: hypothetical protein EOR02_12590 [Mesorhizobium sp.]RWQ53688.1 MAG: hypothetical protein EOS82_08905 [Mesorhizobium sp.]
MDAYYPVPRKRKGRSRVTNGKTLLAGMDGRTKWAKRLHDLVANHVADLGGPSNITQSQFVLIKSAANATIVLEQWELQFAKASTASLPELLAYLSVMNSLRRTYETLGLARVDPPRNIAPIMDMTKLTPAEQQRFKMLSHKADEVGLQGMSESKLRELQFLVEKATGRGSGPSATDAASRERPFHEIDYSRR